MMKDGFDWKGKYYEFVNYDYVNWQTGTNIFSDSVL